MITDSITIRAATNLDGAAIRNLVFAVLREYGLEPDACNTDKDLDDIEANYADRGGTFDVLENARGEILGTSGLFPLDDKTIELRKMYFAKSLRGQGWGKTVLRRAIGAARGLGFEQIYLETNTVLIEAVALYKKFGFVETAEKHSPRCNQAFVLRLKD